jgi:membrane associated rhomboid family serine protease
VPFVYRSKFEIRSVVIGLIILNAAIYLLTQVSSFPVSQGLIARLSGGTRSPGSVPFALAADRYGLFVSLFSLFPAMIAERGWFWQFFTYMFLHGSPVHLFFNMYALLLFGRPLEEKWGWKRFLVFYMVTGVGAGIVTFFWNLFKAPFVPTIGASGAIFGVMLAFGLEFPDIVLLLFFVVPLRARYAVFVYGGIELIMLLTGTMQMVGHFTHLAGLFFGYLYYLIAVRGGFGRVRAGAPRGWPDTSRDLSGAARRGTGIRNSRPASQGPRGRRKGTERLALLTPGVKKHDETGKAREIALALQLKDKIRSGEPLTRAETSYLLKLKKAFDDSRGGICEPEEFDFTAQSCGSCDDFHACLYRFIIGQLRQ